MAADYPPAPGG